VARLALDEYEAAATMRIPEAAEPAEEGLRVANHITQILRQRAGFPPLPQPGTEDFNPKDEPDQINRY
jgi:hypothetical protein